MTVFVKHNNQWSCFKGSRATDKAKSYALRLLSMGIPSEIYLKGWTLIAVYK